MPDPYIDPDLIPLLDALPLTDFDDEVVWSTRELTAELFASYVLSNDVEHTDHRIDPPHGVVVRCHRPGDHRGTLPALLWIHGGGFVVGSHLMDGPLLDTLALELGIAVVAVDYRLAPETPYPGAIDDCHAAFRWVLDHADDLGVEPDRVGVGRQSAGGALAAALTLRCRASGGPSPAFQLLDAPMLDDRQTSHSIQAPGLPVWSTRTNRYAWESYLGDLHGTDRVPADAAPARATDVTGLPPTLVITGGADGLRDEAIAFAQRLLAAGVATELHVIAGAPHGVSMFGDTRVADRWRQTTLSWMSTQV